MTSQNKNNQKTKGQKKKERVNKSRAKIKNLQKNSVSRTSPVDFSNKAFLQEKNHQGAHFVFWVVRLFLLLNNKSRLPQKKGIFKFWGLFLFFEVVKKQCAPFLSNFCFQKKGHKNVHFSKRQIPLQNSGFRATNTLIVLKSASFCDTVICKRHPLEN